MERQGEQAKRTVAAGRAAGRAPGRARRAGMAIAAALGLLGAMLAIGCGPSESRYYCDTTGCYSCDGYGCSNVPAPTPKSCTGNASCDPGSVCTDVGCVHVCQTTSDCAQGTICNGGYCTAPGQDAGAPKQCTSSADCGGAACVANKCQAASSDAGADAAPTCTQSPCACTSSAQCTGGNVCAGGLCTPPADTCKFGSECGTDRSCVDGQCVKTCTDASECGASGFACTKGVCVPNTPPTCSDNTQCSGTTPKCVGGSCVAECTDDATCGDGKYCNQGACVIDTRPKPICSATNTSACGANQQCVGGFCKYTCTTDSQCKLIDARIGYCGQDGVCRTQTEAHPQCTGQGQCPSGQSCIDNVCK